MSDGVRAAAPADADHIAALLGQLGYPTSAEEVVARLGYWLEDRFSQVLVATDGGHIVGCLSVHAIPYLERSGRWARIESLVVDQSARRGGVGRVLVAAAEDLARQWSCLAVEVTSRRSRPDAHAFYAGLGYTDVCHQSGRFWKSLT